MLRRQLERTTRLVAAAAYLLAIAASSLSHVHVHALADADSAHACPAAHNDFACQRHGEDHDAALKGGCHEPADVPTSHDDDCNICRFLGRPILLVRPFELEQISEQVTPLPAMGVPAVQPIILVAMHARAPPCAA